MSLLDIAIKYREKHGMSIPTLTLAKIMFKECSEFRNAEHARDILRYLEGKKTNTYGYKKKHPKFYMPENRPLNPFSLPKSHAEKREPYVLPVGENNILVLSDLHIPYHHVPSIEKAFQYGLDNEINTIILLGDILDNHQISHFQANPAKRSQREEFDICKEFLVRMREVFPNAAIYWAKGNHDIRIEKYLLAKAPELFGDPYYHLEERLRLNEQRIKVIDDKTIIKAGNLTLHHGHLIFGRFPNANPAKTLWDKTNVEFMCGHLHQNISYTKSTTQGAKNCFILGCLSEVGLDVDYNPITNQYRRGFGHVKVTNGKYQAWLINGED